MQNNVTDLSQKLQRSLDNNYNVVDMSAVIEVITALEKTSITKELLETTRLGKYINELRRRTTNDSLAKRAKELLKKWRDLILPDANGQIKRSDSPSSQRASKKRSARTPDAKVTKKIALNGSRELEFSDNSNCSIKDLKKTDVIFINSDSNSSIPDQSNDTTEDATPKKRGRKKGSKNHKNLVIAAEESFSNKMAVSRNSKVKTTQELLADLQNRATTPKNSTAQDIELRAAQLTESLSRIDQKLNPQKQINKNVTPIKNSAKPAPHRTITEVQSWSRTSTPEIVTIQSDDEIVDVVGDSDQKPIKPSSPLTIESLLAKLPPIDTSCLDSETDSCPPCLCPVPEPQNPAESPKSDILEVASSTSDRTNECSARLYLQEKYGGHIDAISLKEEKLPNINGNIGVPCENYQKYSISDNVNSAESEKSVSDCDKSVFREWHETLNVQSYDSELLRILPYVVID